MTNKAPGQTPFVRNPVSTAVVAACGAGMTGLAPAALAQNESVLEEVIVTAQKRDQSVQDIPIAISVLGGEQLEELGITDVEDYVQMFASMSYVQINPGTAEVYIRGISSGANSLLGSNPNVAAYVDEQPVTAVNSYLNPHIYDIQRIETLAGPQGTLFGANAQSGAIRIITNKPDASQFEAGYNLEVNSVNEGGMGYTLEGFANFPINDRSAIRLVGWYKDDAGYIDNVFDTHTFSNANIRAGAADPSLAPDITIDNAQLAEEDFNTAQTLGGRAALKVDLTDNWTLTAGVMRQELDAQGVWDHDPSEVGDLKVSRFMPDKDDDAWTQLSLTVEGQIGDMTLTYAGAYLDRERDSLADYSLYTDYYVSYGFVQRYYSCYVNYFGECVDPRIQFTSDQSWKRSNHELRLQSSGDTRFRWLVGAYYEDGEHAFDLDWHVIGLPGVRGPGGFYCGNVGGTAVEPGFCTAAIDEPDVYWTTDQVRKNEELAFFGQLQFDFTDNLSGSVSGRYFDYKSNLKGFSGTWWFPVETACLAFFQGCGQRPDFNADLDTKDQDSVWRANLSWNLSEDVMLYGTYAQGYRPGGLNRVFNTVIGGAYDPDFVTSYEIGAKSTLADGRLRLNAALYMQDWSEMQFSRFDSSVSPLTLTDNVGDAESNGFEADFSYLISDSWQFSGAISINRAELTTDYWRNPNDIGVTPPQAPAGSPLPRVPELKWNVATRYNWTLANMDTYIQAAYVYTGESWNNLFGESTATRGRQLQGSYQVVNAAWGIQRNSWGAELFVRNMFDERGDVFINAATWDSRVTTNRPRTIGIRFNQRFQ